MKKVFYTLSIFFAALLIGIPAETIAQGGKFELTPFAGYQFGGKLRFYEGDLKIQDNANYGLALDIAMAPNSKLELYWSQMSSTAQFIGTYGYDYLSTDPFDVNVGYIQIGGVQEVEIDNDMIVPFGAFTLGTTYFIPTSNSTDQVKYDDTWKFSVALGGGLKIWLSDRVGIRLQGRLLLPMFWGGAGFTVGTGGSGFTVGAGTSMVQGDFTGGLIIALGD